VLDNLIEKGTRWLRVQRMAIRDSKQVLQVRNRYASLAARWYKSDFDDVDTYCMFIGYPRSGHSLIGGLLDAHPHIVVAYELNALKYVQNNFKERALFYMLLQKSRTFAKEGALSAGYKYYVPGQYNGSYTPPLRVIGDKKGGATSEILTRRPEALKALRDTVKSPVKLIHVVRHPLDNISTISRKHGMTLMEAANYYFALCETVTQIKEETGGENWFEMHLESFVQSPRSYLSQLCAFLGQEALPTYIESCSELVFDSPNKSRDKVEWPEEVKHRVQDGMHSIPYLNSYTFKTPDNA
jgi:hypothetical protein